jgi:hypothetical protein
VATGSALSRRAAQRAGSIRTVCAQGRNDCTASVEPFGLGVALTAKQRLNPMTIESVIRLLAGSVVLLSLALSQFTSPLWLFLAAFVRLDPAQSALTGFCPAEMVFKRLGQGGSCSPRGDS